MDDAMKEALTAAAQALCDSLYGDGMGEDMLVDTELNAAAAVVRAYLNKLNPAEVRARAFGATIAALNSGGVGDYVDDVLRAIRPSAPGETP